MNASRRIPNTTQAMTTDETKPLLQSTQWWVGWSIIAALVAAQSPIHLWVVSHGFPTDSGKSQIQTLWAIAMVGVDLSAILLWTQIRRPTWLRVGALALGMLGLCAAALPLSLMLSGFIHAKLQ